MLNNLQFWTLLAGFLAFVAKFFWPELPLDATLILSVIMVALAAFGIYPKFRYAYARVTMGDLVNSLEFWTLLAGLAGFVIYYYAPDFPFEEGALLATILYILKLFGISPSVLERIALCVVRAAEQAALGDDTIYKKDYAMNAARAALKAYGYIGRCPDDLLDAAIEKAVFDQFNDPVVHKYLSAE